MRIRTFVGACLLPLLFVLGAVRVNAASTGVITGTVVTGDGRAAAGARISAFALESAGEQRARWVSTDPARKPLATGVTDAKGNFAMEVTASVVDLAVEAAGHAAAGARAAANEDAGVLQLGTDRIVRAAITANGKPVSGATVVVCQNGAESITVTGADGKYPLPDPRRLPSHIFVHHPDYVFSEHDLGPTLPARADVALSPGRPLRGRVVAADGETPVAGAVVLIDNVPVGATGADGAFATGHAPAGARRIVARSGNLIAARQTGAATEVVLRLAPAASVSGSIRDLSTGSPIAGAEVTATAPRFTGTDPGGSAVTDAKGSYSIGGLAGGDYELAARHPGYLVPQLTMNLRAGAAARKVLYAAALASIAGSVVDEDLHGIAGTQVTLRSLGGAETIAIAGLLRSPQPALTAPDGRFLVRTGIEGNVQLDAAKKGLPAAHSGTLRMAGGAPKRGVRIVVPRGVALAGRVTDGNRKPVGGADVTAAEPGGAATARRTIMNSLQRGSEDLVRTAADGTFVLRLREGEYDVLVTAPGFAPRTARAQAAAGSPPLVIQLEPGVAIGGRVTRGGEPVEGVNVFVISGDAGSPVQTGPDGGFRMVDLSPGPVTLAFRKIGDFIQTSRAVTAPAGDVNVDLPAGGRVAGHVVDRTTREAVKAFDAGVSVSRGSAVMMVAPVMHGYTSDDGAFAIDGVPAGSQILAVSAPGYLMARVPNVKVESGRSVEDIEVTLDRGARVSGHVTSQDGAPLGGVLVSSERRGAAMNDPYTLTNPEGEYSLDNMEQGELAISFSRSGLLTVEKRVDVSGETTRVDAQLTPGVSIGGVVTLESGAPVAEAEVQASSAADAGFVKSTQTDATGMFTILSAAPGRYEIRAGKPGYAGAVLRDVNVNGAGSLHLILKGGGTIAGRITGLTAAELRSAVVRTSSTEGGVASASPDGGGSYRIDGVPAGTVRVVATAGENASSSRTAPSHSVLIDGGTTVNVDFDFSSSIVIRGRVTRNGVAMAGATVSFSPRSGAGRFARTTAEGNGAYEITGIDEGSYVVTVTDVDHALHSTPYEVSGSATFDIDMRGATLTGRVSDAASGAAIPNATIELGRKDAGLPYLRSALADANGAFSFDQVPSGSYEARGEKAGYGAASVPVTVGGNGENGEPAIEVKLVASAGLRLRLADARDGRPLAGWYHAAAAGGESYDGAVGGGVESARVGLAAGAYRMTAGAYGYAARTFSVTVPGEQTVLLAPGGTILVSSGNATLAYVRLVDAAGQPYRSGPGSTAGLFGVDPAPGQTPIADIAPGRYTLQLLDQRGNVIRSAEVTVIEGVTVAAKL